MSEFFALEVNDPTDGSVMQFDVMEKRYDPTRYELVVAPSVGSGCVLMLFDPTPRNADTVVIIEAIKYDKRCTSAGTPPMPRKYGTRTMMLGAMHAMMFRAAQRYPHLAEFQLQDEAKYPCPDLAPDATVKTFATDLLLDGRTYYERHIGMLPIESRVANIADGVRARMRTPIDMPFDDFWDALTVPSADRGDIWRPSEHYTWLESRKPELKQMYEQSRSDGDTWHAFFSRVHSRWNCAFFATCWWRLCQLFGMQRIVGATYRVAFEDVPSRVVLLRKQEQRQLKRGGGALGVGGVVPEKAITRLRRLNQEVFRIWAAKHGM
jgi:hypothetical protein